MVGRAEVRGEGPAGLVAGPAPQRPAPEVQGARVPLQVLVEVVGGGEGHRLALARQVALEFGGLLVCLVSSALPAHTVQIQRPGYEKKVKPISGPEVGDTNF